MKALYYPEWERLEVRELPRPILENGEVVVRVSACGICGSELETFRTLSRRRTPPLVMGHEFCGVIEESCSTKRDWKIGSRVVVHAVIHCGQCALCLRGDTNLCLQRKVFGLHRPGAFAEYVAVPEQVLVPWPDGMPETTAIFAEPLANGINVMRQGSAARKSRVVIIGAGPIGLMCLFAAKQLHQSTVVVADRISERLAVARALGADRVINVLEGDLSQAVSSCWAGAGAEFVVDAVGSSTTKRLSIELAEPGGAIVWAGLHEDLLHLNSYSLTLQQKSVSGTYSGSMTDLETAIDLLASRDFDTSWATSYPLREGETAFRSVLSSQGPNIKAILQLNGNHA